jgi:hypothetical protein
MTTFRFVLMIRPTRKFIPVCSTFEDVAGDISVTVDKYRNTMLNGAHREKSKLLLR